MHHLIQEYVQAGLDETAACQLYLTDPVREADAVFNAARARRHAAFEAALAHVDTLKWPENSEFLAALQSQIRT